MRSEQSGVWGEGLSRTVLPARSAGTSALTWIRSASGLVASATLVVVRARIATHRGTVRLDLVSSSSKRR